MFTQIILFAAVYTFIGTLVAGYIVPKRKWEDVDDVTDFIVMMVAMWWIQMCVAIAFKLAVFFYEEDDE